MIEVPTELCQEYENLYANLAVNDDARDDANRAASMIRRRESFYGQVGLMPWWFIGILHAMECDLSLRGCLHNGDPLTDAKGRPVKTVSYPEGRGPFENWIDAARDALIFDFHGLIGIEGDTLHAFMHSGLVAVQGFDFSAICELDTAAALWLFERYNGFGYRKFGVNSPYLWAGSEWYSAGKFVKDGKFSETARSEQTGAAVILKALNLTAECLDTSA